jgi:cobalt-zinc-cadmium efflux system membrane fusion protein
MRLSRRAQVLALLGVAGAVALASLARATLKHDSPPPAPAAPAPGTFRPSAAQWATFKLATVESRTFRCLQLTDGRIALDEERVTPVFSPFSGRITRVIAKLGDQVKRGDPLIAVAAPELVQAQSDVRSAGAALDTARSQLALAQANEQRTHELLLARSGAEKDWRQAQAERVAAQNALRAAESAHGAAMSRLHILGGRDERAAEGLVRAPIAGTIVQRQVGAGQYLSSGANAVYSIGDLSRVWLVANVRETDAPFVRSGEPHEVRVLAYARRVFHARIAWIAPSLDATTRRLAVRAEIENSDGALKPQMYATFSIVTGDDVAAPAVPQSAVIYEGAAARVWVAGDDGSVAARAIEVGRSQDGWLQVTRGLAAGERVVASGTLFIDRAAAP